MPLQLTTTSPGNQHVFFPDTDVTPVTDNAEFDKFCSSRPTGDSMTSTMSDICCGFNPRSCLSSAAIARVTDGSNCFGSVEASGLLHRASVLPMRLHIQHLKCTVSVSEFVLVLLALTNECYTSYNAYGRMLRGCDEREKQLQLMNGSYLHSDTCRDRCKQCLMTGIRTFA
jgi:hypothetical protein